MNSKIKINCKRKIVPNNLLDYIVIEVNPNNCMEKELINALNNINEPVPLYKKITIGNIELDGEKSFLSNDVQDDASIIFGEYGNITNINIIFIPNCDKFIKQTYYIKVNLPICVEDKSVYKSFSKQLHLKEILYHKDFPSNNEYYNLYENPCFYNIKEYIPKTSKVNMIIDRLSLTNKENNNPGHPLKRFL